MQPRSSYLVNISTILISYTSTTTKGGPYTLDSSGCMPSTERRTSALLTLQALRVISIKFLLVISMLCKTQWSWDSRTWSHKMNLLDILSTSPHCFCGKWIGATNENSNLDRRVMLKPVQAGKHPFPPGCKWPRMIWESTFAHSYRPY